MLEIVSYHRLSPEQESKKICSNATITFGRSTNNDWYLPDPEKVVSGLHARIEKKTDGFFLTDCSTNGLFINRAVEPLGNGNTYKLMDADLLTFGDYEVKVSLQVAQSIANSHSSEEVAPNALMTTEINQPPASSTQHETFKTTKQATEFKSVDEHFLMPNAIPEEWNIPLLNEENIPSALKTESNSNYTPTEQIVPKENTINHDVKTALSGDSVQKNNPGNELFLAFLQGLNCNIDLQEQLTPEFCLEMGESFHELLVGLMLSLRNRSAIKNEFRINQTTFKHTENNPIKFSASIEDLIQNLYVTKSRSFLNAKNSIRAAFKDTETHEQSILAGTQGVFEGLLNQLSPQNIMNKEYQRNALESILPNQKQAKYWKLYNLLHDDLTQELSKSKSPVWHDDFVTAYDKKLKSLS